MSAFMRSVVLLGTISTLACGATASQGGTVQTPAGRPPVIQPSGPAEANTSAIGVIPSGQELDVRMQQSLSSETAKVEQRFDATTAVDLMQNGRVLVPAGSTVHGVVSEVHPAGRLADRTGSLTLSFDRMTVRGRDYPIRGMATQIFQSGGIREEAGTAGVGAGVGGVIGGLLGGVKGAILGAVIGAGGAIAATDGKDVNLPAGTVIRMRLDSDVNTR
jgi:hypothetical protein